MSLKVKYSISFNNPSTHYCEITITAPSHGKNILEFGLPVWTPGSYKLREYSRHVDKVRAEDSTGKGLNCEKVSKNSWKVATTEAEEIVLSYRVYCNELTVRASEITSDHAFLNGTNIFMFVRGMLDAECELKISPYKDWKKISTGLTKVSDNLYTAPDYDTFVDCPIEIGNQEILEFEAAGKKHYISIYGKGNYDTDKFVTDFKKIVETESKMFGGLPYDHFTFLLIFGNGGGGLEHLNSFAAMYPAWVFDDEKKYKKFLGLIAHELFHVWNVKRVRPIELGPFDYDREVYTKMHWVTEGWTSFFDNLILRRAELVDDKEYFEFVAEEMNEVMSTQGRFHQSLEESSYDNWIKFYERHANTRNDQISYYKKGALIAMMLDIEIITGSKNDKSLDEVLKALFDDYKNNPSRGYTPERVKLLCEQMANKNLDEFWTRFIEGTDDLPLRDYLSKAGVEMNDANKPNEVKLGIVQKKQNDNVEIAEVYDGGSAYAGGLETNDEIIAVNGTRVNTKNLSGVLSTHKLGDEVEVTYSRNGVVRTLKMKILPPLPKYELKFTDEPTAEQKAVWEKWLKG